jgi:nitrate reductase molybdenum cofactor assembly chaperone NarJ/NarW
VIEFRALSALLSYPTADLRQALPEVAAAVTSSTLIAERERVGIMALIDELAGSDLMAAEARYVELFDRGRATSLHLFEHLYGDGRDRGEAMVDLKRVYEREGFALATSELPDYLPVLLEYLSCRDLAEARDMLSDCAQILRRITESLIARDSAYAGLLQALIVIAGETPVDAGSVSRARHERENLDRDWFEEPAFAGVPLASLGRTIGKVS